MSPINHKLTKRSLTSKDVTNNLPENSFENGR